MKLRISRRIKVEEESSEEETPVEIDSSRAQEQVNEIKDILPVVTSKSIPVSSSVILT